jgi:ribosomal protein S6E (S10)
MKLNISNEVNGVQKSYTDDEVMIKHLGLSIGSQVIFGGYELDSVFEATLYFQVDFGTHGWVPMIEDQGSLMYWMFPDHVEYTGTQYWVSDSPSCY